MASSTTATTRSGDREKSLRVEKTAVVQSHSMMGAFLSYLRPEMVGVAALSPICASRCTGTHILKRFSRCKHSEINIGTCRSTSHVCLEEDWDSYCHLCKAVHPETLKEEMV
jgi:hypothetical protein